MEETGINKLKFTVSADTYEAALAQLEALRVKADNLAFAMLPAREKRVAIARDVIEQLAAGKLTAFQGSFVRLRDGMPLMHWGADDQQLDKVLDGHSCQVCALGAVFTCAVKRLDNLTLGQVRKRESKDALTEKSIMPYLSDLFAGEQLKLIEIAFEHGIGVFGSRALGSWGPRPGALGSWGPGEHVPGEERAIAFDEEQWNPPRERMIKIMQNIIDHDGEFCP